MTAPRVFPVIIAGGSGTRFWPFSRSMRPKQFLPIAGEIPLLRSTFERARSLGADRDVVVVASRSLLGPANRILGEDFAGQLIGEPTPRDTAAAVGLGAAHVAAVDPDGVMVVLAADHVIGPLEAFRQTYAAAARFAHETGALVTVGIRPAGPATGFGYIRRADQRREMAGRTFRRVSAFTEKPDEKRARRFVEGGEHFWNSGTFVWRAGRILEEIDRHMSELGRGLATIRAAIGTDGEERVLDEVFPSLPRTSIDYGIMEKADDVWMVEADFEWDDVGSWNAAGRHLGTDAEGNARQGVQTVCVESRGCVLVGSPGHLIATVGVNDLVVVQTGDATLVAHRSQVERIKEVVARLKDLGREDLL